MVEKKMAKPLFVGGIIPDEDGKRLKDGGVFAVFGPGASIQEIVDEVKKAATA